MKGVTIVKASCLPPGKLRVSQAGRLTRHGRVAAQARLAKAPRMDRAALVPFPIPSSFPPRICWVPRVSELCSHQGGDGARNRCNPYPRGPGFTGKADICSVISDTR